MTKKRKPSRPIVPYCVYIDREGVRSNNSVHFDKVSNLRRPVDTTGSPDKRQYVPCMVDDINPYFNPEKPKNLSGIFRNKGPPKLKNLVRVEPLAICESFDKASEYRQERQKLLGRGQRLKIPSGKQSDTPPSIFLKTCPTEDGIKARLRTNARQKKELSAAVSRAVKKGSDKIAKLMDEDEKKNASLPMGDHIDTVETLESFSQSASTSANDSAEKMVSHMAEDGKLESDVQKPKNKETCDKSSDDEEPDLAVQEESTAEIGDISPNASQKRNANHNDSVEKTASPKAVDGKVESDVQKPRSKETCDISSNDEEPKLTVQEERNAETGDISPNASPESNANNDVPSLCSIEKTAGQNVSDMPIIDGSVEDILTMMGLSNVAENDENEEQLGTQNEVMSQSSEINDDAQPDQLSIPKRNNKVKIMKMEDASSVKVTVITKVSPPDTGKTKLMSNKDLSSLSPRKVQTNVNISQNSTDSVIVSIHSTPETIASQNKRDKINEQVPAKRFSGKRLIGKQSLAPRKLLKQNTAESSTEASAKLDSLENDRTFRIESRNLTKKLRREKSWTSEFDEVPELANPIAKEVAKLVLKKVKTENSKLANYIVGKMEANFVKYKRNESTDNNNDGNAIQDLYNIDKIGEPDADGNVVHDGRKFNWLELQDALKADKQRQRFNHVMKALWSEDELVNMCLAHRKNPNNTVYKRLSDVDINSAIAVFKKIGKSVPIVDDTSENVNKHHRLWISAFLRTYRTSHAPGKKEATAERKKRERLARQSKKNCGNAKESGNAEPTENSDDDQTCEVADVKSICKDVTDSLPCTAYDETNVENPKEPQTGINVKSFAEKHNISEELADLIFHPIACIRSDDDYCRIVCPRYEAKTLKRILDHLTVSEVLPTENHNPEELLRLMEAWDVPSDIAEFMFNKYTRSSKKSNSDVSRCLNFERIAPPIVYDTLCELQWNASTGEDIKTLSDLKLLLSEVPYSEEILKTEWVKILKDYGTIITNNGIHSFKFNEKAVPQFSSIAIILSIIKDTVKEIC